MTDPTTPPPAEPGPGAAQYAQPQAAAPLAADQDKLWASLAHFGGILYLLPSLIIWLVFKDRGARTNVEGKEALNWQITFVIGYIALWIIYGILAAILTAIAIGTLSSWPLAIAGFLFWLPGILWVLNVIFSIMGGIKVQGGGSYRYPVNFRFIK